MSEYFFYGISSFSLVPYFEYIYNFTLEASSYDFAQLLLQVLYQVEIHSNGRNFQCVLCRPRLDAHDNGHKISGHSNAENVIHSSLQFCKVDIPTDQNRSSGLKETNLETTPRTCWGDHRTLTSSCTSDIPPSPKQER